MTHATLKLAAGGGGPLPSRMSDAESEVCLPPAVGQHSAVHTGCHGRAGRGDLQV